MPILIYFRRVPSFKTIYTRSTYSIDYLNFKIQAIVEEPIKGRIKLKKYK